MDGLVTVIIPVYNTGAVIQNCVDSVLQSSYINLEVFLIDDGSDKETANECDKLAQKDTRIKVVHQRNSGVSAARNRGLDLAQGEFVTFVDADDTIEKDLFQTLVEAMKKEDADIVISGHKECYEDGNTKECFCNKKIVIKRGRSILSDFFTTNNISWPVWAKLYKRTAIGTIRFKVGKQVAEDMFFNYEVLKNANIIVECGFPGYNYIKHGKSVMDSLDCTKFFDSFYLTKAVFDDIQTNETFGREKAYFYIKSELFFFRFIYAKDKKQTATQEIKKARRIFFGSLNKSMVCRSGRMKIEIFLLKYFEPLFRIQAKIYWGMRM